MWWAEGVSGPEIARRLCITRNAVAGKLNRLNLVRKRSPRRKPAPAANPFPYLNRKPPKPEPPETWGPVRIENLDRRHCKWVLGEPSDLTYCGQRREDGSPYCGAHDAAARSRPLRGGLAA
jgi:GcrA cell cycle regulator